MNTDREKILKVNELFYKALGTRDLNLMENVWVKDERAGCVHPGWTILRSWQSIKHSWQNVFDPTDQVDINISNIELEIKNNMAWLTCIQEMIYKNREPVMYNISQSTNIFEKSNNDWLMLIHHASPFPFNDYQSQKLN